MVEQSAGDRPEALAGWLTELIEEIGVLTGRRRGDPGQPVVSLTGSGASSALRTVLKSLDTSKSRKVPHVRVDTAPVTEVRALLKEAADGLASGPFGRGLRLQFPRFWFLDWLMNQPTPEGTERERRARLARDVRRASGQRAELKDGAKVVTGWSGLVLLIVSTVVPAMVFRVLVSGRVPGPGRVFRWLMRQRYASQGSSDFWAFAMRLTDGARKWSEGDQVQRLLVHAFLQDLCDQYQRVPWRIRTWRRTAYPVLLLDGVRDDGPGAELLRLVALVRTRPPAPVDPLLVIAAETGDAPVGSPSAEVVLLSVAGNALRRWRNIPRTEREHGRFVVDVPGDSGLEHSPSALPQIVPRRPPWLVHPVALVVVPVLPLLAVGAWLGYGWRSDCLPVHFGGRIDVELEHGQCVGYSDDESQVFGQDAVLVSIQRKIFAQNRAAEAAQKRKRDQPHVTVVYLGTLTEPGVRQADEETFAAEREELEGIAVAQYRANQEAQVVHNAPLLRVVVANGGQEMEAAESVARMLSSLREDDQTVVGIVGLVESRSWTKEALRVLDVTGLPVIAPTLSADDIGKLSSHYLQISPANIDQARMVHEYVTRVLGRGELFNYYTYGAGGKQAAGTDLYVDTLKDDLKSVFAASGHSYKELYWSGESLDDVCRRPYDGVVFFGGRYSDFAAFLKQIAEDCNGRLPVIIGDDSVNRYMANASARGVAPDNLSLAYVSKGALAFCDRLASAQASRDVRRSDFLNAVREVLDRCEGPDNLPVGERVGLAYDGVRLLLRGVQNIAVNRPNSGIGHPWDPAVVSPGELYTEIRRHTAQATYSGVTGRITFDHNGVVVGKPLSLLCVTDIKRAFTTEADVPSEVFRVGADDFSAPPPPRRCE